MDTVITSNVPGGIIEGTDLFKIFSARNLYIKKKAKTGYRIYKNKRQFRFFDWFPTSGSLTQFNGKWKALECRSQDPVTIANFIKNIF